jgi:phage anti-repressor protein
MPTLEEAIGIFEQLSKLCETNGIHDSQELYKQYAAWLRELQERRKASEIIYCKDCTRRRKNTETGEYYCRASGLRNTDYDFCSGGKRAERRTE